MKKLFVGLILVSFIFIPIVKAEEDMTPNAKSAILIEASTGKILYNKNENEELAPASMTKVMSLLLIMEALEKGQIKLDDEVQISENAASMGGSQLFLQPNTTAKVEELIKGIAIASGNDAVVAMAEKINGTEEKFVESMNKKAKDLGLTHTHFVNPHGLDAEGHYTSAHDMAMMAKELIKHEQILNYTSIYEEYLTKSDGTKLWMVNTNKLIKFYNGTDGLKTGFTAIAGYCLTATAMRNQMRLISVVMGEDSSQNRTTDTVTLLNYGFNSFKLNNIIDKDANLGSIKINKGKKENVSLQVKNDITELLSISNQAKEYSIDIKKDDVTAPVKVGDKVGTLYVKDNKKIVYQVDLTVKEDVTKANFLDLFTRNFSLVINGN